MIPRLPLVCAVVIAAAYLLACGRERLPDLEAAPSAPVPDPAPAPQPDAPEVLRAEVCTREGIRTALVFGTTRDVILTGILMALEIEGHLLLAEERQRKERAS